MKDLFSKTCKIWLPRLLLKVLLYSKPKMVFATKNVKVFAIAMKALTYCLSLPPTTSALSRLSYPYFLHFFPKHAAQCTELTALALDVASLQNDQSNSFRRDLILNIFSSAVSKLKTILVATLTVVFEVYKYNHCSENH